MKDKNFLDSSVRFKFVKDKELILLVRPVILSLFYGCVVPIVEQNIYNYKITVTRTVAEKENDSISNSHAEGRAIDIRIKDMPKNAPTQIVCSLNEILSKEFGAISHKSKKPVFAVLEKDHIHLQTRFGVYYNILIMFACAKTYMQLNKGAYSEE